MSNINPNLEYQLVLCTCPNPEVAEKLARLIIESKFAACVNMVPNLTSVYTWQEKIETSTEVLLIIKTKANIYHKLEGSLKKAHPYECPEIIAIPITKGSEQYLQWIDKTLL